MTLEKMYRKPNIFGLQNTLNENRCCIYQQRSIHMYVDVCTCMYCNNINVYYLTNAKKVPERLQKNDG